MNYSMWDVWMVILFSTLVYYSENMPIWCKIGLLVVLLVKAIKEVIIEIELEKIAKKMNINIKGDDK